MRIGSLIFSQGITYDDTLRDQTGMPGWCRVFMIPAQHWYRHIPYTVQLVGKAVTSWASKWGLSAIGDSRHVTQERATRTPARISSTKGSENGTGQLSTTIWRGEITMGIEWSHSHLPMAFYSRSHYGGTWQCRIVGFFLQLRVVIVSFT